MARHTEQEKYERKVRALIKKVYSENLGRSKDEIISITKPHNRYAYVVKRGNEETIILKSSLDNYFNTSDKDIQKAAIGKIEKALRDFTIIAPSFFSHISNKNTA
jgi:hypothetical protein